MPPSKAYLEHLKRGPFPGQIDPWAEIGRYFQQIHSEIISQLIRQIQEPLENMGYFAGRETSLLIGQEQSKPDIQIESGSAAVTSSAWSYDKAAEAVMAEPVVRLVNEDDWQHRIVINQAKTGRLVTVVEIVSPRNKLSPSEMNHYRLKRDELLHEQVNVVEIDLTRSFSRLLQTGAVEAYPYHVLIFMPGEHTGFTDLNFSRPLPRIALPLRQDVIAVELQQAYDDGYQSMRIARHIFEEGRYTDDDLPFPTTLTKAQRQAALDKVTAWRAELDRLTGSENA